MISKQTGWNPQLSSLKSNIQSTAPRAAYALKYSIIKADGILTIWTTVLHQNHYSVVLQVHFCNHHAHILAKIYTCTKSVCLKDSEGVFVLINLCHWLICIISIQKFTIRFWYQSRYLLLAHIKTQTTEFNSTKNNVIGVISFRTVY